MKKIIQLFALAAVCVCCAFGIEPVSVNYVITPTNGITLDTQQIVFLRSLKEEYEAIDTWLSEAEDLSSFVSEGQTLVFPESGAAPAVYKNRTTDVDSVEPTETVYTVSLDVYDSQNYKLRNIYLHALPFNKIQHYTKKSADSIVRQEIIDAAHAFCPDISGNKKVIIGTTGGARNGYRMFTLDDITRLARACDNQGFPQDGRNLVLPSDMWWDLVNNNVLLKGQLERAPLTGIIKPTIVEYYGFKIHKSAMPINIGYDLSTNQKAVQGALIGDDVVLAGFVFCSSEVFRAGGQFMMSYLAFANNPSGRAEEFGFQHRFKAGFQLSGNRYSGLVYCAPAESAPEEA
jgi:hypothetical protein